MRSDACGTGVDQDASANSWVTALPLEARRTLSAAWLASGAWNTTPASYWPTSSRNQEAPVHCAARHKNGELISTAFVESSVNEIIAKRMNKRQQMRWNRATVQPASLDV